MMPAKENAQAGVSGAGHQGRAQGTLKRGGASYPRTVPDGRSEVAQKLRNAEISAKLMATLLPTTLERATFLRKLLANTAGNDGDTQASRLLRSMREGERVTTYEARTYLDVSAPGARIWHLRHIRGFEILMTWVMQVSPAGRVHRIGCYTLARTGDGQ